MVEAFHPAVKLASETEMSMLRAWKRLNESCFDHLSENSDPMDRMAGRGIMTVADTEDIQDQLDALGLRKHDPINPAVAFFSITETTHGMDTKYLIHPTFSEAWFESKKWGMVQKKELKGCIPGGTIISHNLTTTEINHLAEILENSSS